MKIENVQIEERNHNIPVEKIANTIMVVMKNGRASRPGGITVEILKYRMSGLQRMLATLFNWYIDGGKVGHLTSVFRKRGSRNCDNYRNYNFQLVAKEDHQRIN